MLSGPMILRFELDGGRGEGLLGVAARLRPWNEVPGFRLISFFAFVIQIGSMRFALILDPNK